MILISHGSGIDPTDMDAWFSAVLSRAGLPSMDQICSAAMEELEDIRSSAITGEASDRLTQLLSIGRAQHSAHGLRLNAPYQGIDDLIPPIVLSDDTILRPSNALKSDIFADPAEWIDRAWAYSNSIREFVGACLP
jgi:hypothetical protein